MHGCRRSGFTLLETILSVTIIGLLAGLSIPVFYSFQANNSTGLAADIIAQSLRRAQSLSQAVSGDAEWGVKVVTTTATLFQGPSFASRNASFDEVFEFSQNVIVSGTSEFVFMKLYGYPQPTGSIQLISTGGNNRIVTLNEKGTITY